MRNFRDVPKLQSTRGRIEIQMVHLMHSHNILNISVNNLLLLGVCGNTIFQYGHINGENGIRSDISCSQFIFHVSQGLVIEAVL